MHGVPLQKKTPCSVLIIVELSPLCSSSVASLQLSHWTF